MLASFLNYAELRLYHKVPNLVSMLQTHVVAIEESGIYFLLSVNVPTLQAHPKDAGIPALIRNQ